ncbi:hypothetical protein I79_020138 [Cricetulus griseus]|uniref:Uncharacterized protein n=1 Tax=Cricetulus griseus TaxID=10029 RepID=G3I9A2_CRIGR|nr:hypothetical protein I79_020138 [Cricetulus griseus]
MLRRREALDRMTGGHGLLSCALVQPRTHRTHQGPNSTSTRIPLSFTHQGTF